MNKIILLFLLVCIVQSQKISGQTVTYIVSDNLTVCEQNIITFEVTNTGSSILNNPEISIDLPCGFTYIPSSISNATQKNITNLNVPSFTLNNIAIGEKITISISANIGCEAVACVNDLEIFNIKSTFTANNNTTESTSLPFNVQSPNLVITRIENPYSEAEFNDVITRKITVKNARLGKLAQLKYKNTHDGNVDITLEGGLLISKTTKIIEQAYGALDFRKIGNKDDFLDFNEEIVIVEKLKINTCIFENQFNTATIDVSWGCNNIICQNVKANATIKILPSQDKGPKIGIRTTSTNPDCYFPGMALQKLEILESFHKNALLDFELEIHQTLGNRGIKVGSITAPFTNNISYKGLFTNECGESLARTAVIRVPRFEPLNGQKLSTITWQTAFCEEVDCDPKLNTWLYSYSYEKECSEFNDINFTGKGVSADSLRSALETFFLIDSLMGPLQNLDTAIAKYTIFGDKLIQNQGVVTISFDFPTILELLTTDFKLGDKLPFAIDTSFANDRVQIKLSYNLPLSAKDLEMFIPFVMNCDAVNSTEPCVQRPYSSCTFFCGIIKDSDFIDSKTSIDFGGNCPDEGLLKSCYGSSFSLLCDNKEVCYDTIPGFYDHRFKLFRTNYGLSDKDNNGFPDANNNINPSTLRLTEFMPGDTMKIIFDGVIKVDIPGSSFSNLYILLEQGEFLSSNEANTEFMQKLIMGDGKGLKQYSSVLRIYDKSEDRYYSLDNVTSVLMDDINNFDLSVATLHMLYPTFPSDFRYQEGDSVYLKTNSRFDIEAYKAVQNELAFRQYVTFKYRTKSVLDNKPLGDESSYSICNCFDEVVTVAGFNLTAPVLSSLIFNEAGICDESTYNNLIFIMNIGHDLKSPTELREVARPKGIRITKMPDFDFETLTIEYKNKFYSFEPIITSTNEYFYDLTGVFPFAGGFTGNQYKFKIVRRLKECLSKVTPTPFVYTIFFEKNDIGELYFPDSIVGTIQNFYTLPTLALELNQKNITAFTNKVGFEMRVLEKTNFKFDVKDLFMRVTTTSGLKNVRIYNPDTGADFDLNNGISYLGTLEKGKIKNIEFIAESESCGEEKIFIEYGYDCGIYTDIASSPCFIGRDSVLVTFPGSVVDLQPETVNTDISLCTEISNTLYVYNAGLGTAFDMNVGMNLPTGMTLIPGSCKLFYPSGGTQSFAIPDPVMISGNNFLWVLNDIWPLHKLSGLNGTAFSPNNGFDIVFNTTTNCDFISGTTIIYNTDANQICNIPTNKVAKVSNSFNINGVLPPYTLNVLSDYAKSPNCKNDSLQVHFTFDKPLANEGNIYIDLPQGWSFVPNSASGNLINNVPIQQSNKLVWDINSTSPNIDMTFWLQKSENAACQPTIINIYTTLSASAFCTSSMEECDIETITGSSILTIPQENPVFEINNFQVETDASLDARVTVTISNISDNISDDVIGKVYLDLDGNGMFSAGDQFLSEIIFSGFDDVNKTITQIVTLNEIGNADFCSLLFVLPKADNCICEDLISTIKLPSRVITEPKVICSGDAINIGVTSTPNVVYQWNIAEGLSCTQCANAGFSVVNNTPNPITFKRILTTTNSNGCQTLYEYDITIQPKPTVLSQNLSICVGDTLTAIATLGTSYIWDGPNIIENGNQLLLANPSISTSYSVTITDQNGCSGSGAFAVNVRNKPSVEVVYDSLFCYGPSPALNLVLEPNTTFRWLNANGALSDLNTTNPVILTQQDITLRLEVRNQNCVTNLDVPIKFYEAFMVTGVADTLGICKGEKVNLNLAGGQTYNISPSNFVECLNPECSDISIDAMFAQQTFLITAQDQDMCISERLFTINTFTDTIRMSEQLSICEGESIVIFDENVTVEGIYCDTIKVANSACVTVVCKTLTVRPKARQDQTVDICAGDTYIFNGQTITQAGQYCNTFTSVNGCDSISCVTVSLNSLPDLTNLNIEYSVKSGDTISLIAPNGFSSYRWSPSTGLSCDDCPAPLAFPQEDFIYTLEVTNSDGCIAMRTVRIIVTPSCVTDIPTIPNAFTPNNDGINDFYTLGDIDFCGPMIFTVYNRWGNQVYQMVDWDNKWDGYSNNLGELPQGTYYISIEFVSEGVIRVGFVDLRKK